MLSNKEVMLSNKGVLFITKHYDSDSFNLRTTM